MRLPNWESAYVPAPKLEGYLLSDVHPVGRAKSLFLKNLGYDSTNLGVLERDLVAVAHEEDVLETYSIEYGTKYVIDGVLQTPNGAAVLLRTVWIVDRGDYRPRFVTAYPI